jgi:hypothetical protein
MRPEQGEFLCVLWHKILKNIAEYAGILKGVADPTGLGGHEKLNFL